MQEYARAPAGRSWKIVRQIVHAPDQPEYHEASSQPGAEMIAGCVHIVAININFQKNFDAKVAVAAEGRRGKVAPGATYSVSF